MGDPYRILGVSPNASEEEIKNAYRALARKYQSENYEGNPLGDIAAKKMKELDEAYDAVITMRRSGGAGGGSAQYSNTQSSYGSGDYYDVRIKLSAGRIDDAEMILDGVPEAQRQAEWNFLKGTVQYKRGWFEEAYKHFSAACRMDPTNKEYRAALNQLNRQRSGGYRMQAGPAGCSTCDCCTSLICADCCCECCGVGNGRGCC